MVSSRGTRRNAQRASSDPLVQERPDTISKDVFDYFAGEIFERSEARVQEFLLQTAFLPKMTVRMAEQLTGTSGSARILAELNRQNYFTEKRGDDPAIASTFTSPRAVSICASIPMRPTSRPIVCSIWVSSSPRSELKILMVR